MPTGLRQLYSDAYETVKQYREHNRCYDHIHVVVLLEEREQRKCNSCNRSRNEQEDAELYQCLRAQPKCIARDFLYAFKCIRLPAEHPVISDAIPVQRQEQYASSRRNRCSDNHSPTEQISNEQLNVLVAPPSSAPQWITQMPPRNPLYAISIARKTITAVKIARSAGTLAPASTRAPVSAPARTPSITGKAMTGSM